MADERKRRRWGWTVTMWLVIVLVLYVLSMGPAVRLMTISYNDGRFGFWEFYKPIVKAAKWPPFGRPLAAYLNLWAPQRAVHNAEFGIGIGHGYW